MASCECILSQQHKSTHLINTGKSQESWTAQPYHAWKTKWDAFGYFTTCSPGKTTFAAINMHSQEQWKLYLIIYYNKKTVFVLNYFCHIDPNNYITFVFIQYIIYFINNIWLDATVFNTTGKHLQDCVTLVSELDAMFKINCISCRRIPSICLMGVLKDMTNHNCFLSA